MVPAMENWRIYCSGNTIDVDLMLVDTMRCTFSSHCVHDCFRGIIVGSLWGYSCQLSVTTSKNENGWNTGRAKLGIYHPVI